MTFASVMYEVEPASFWYDLDISDFLASRPFQLVHALCILQKLHCCILIAPCSALFQENQFSSSTLNPTDLRRIRLRCVKQRFARDVVKMQSFRSYWRSNQHLIAWPCLKFDPPDSWSYYDILESLDLAEIRFESLPRVLHRVHAFSPPHYGEQHLILAQDLLYFDLAPELCLSNVKSHFRTQHVHIDGFLLAHSFLARALVLSLLSPERCVPLETALVPSAGAHYHKTTLSEGQG